MEELIKVVEELNEVLGLQPEIETEGISEEDLTKAIQETVDELEPADKPEDFSEETVVYLRKFGAWEEEEEEKPKPKRATKAKKAVVKTTGKAAEKKPVEKPKKDPKRTKKAVVLEMIDQKGGATIDDIAQKIVDEGIDPDLTKNKTVVKLWLGKMGHDVKKARLVENPIFKSSDLK